MYKVDIENKSLIKLKPADFSSLKLKERYDIEEWIEKNPEILGEDLLIIGKELVIGRGIRLDLLAIDRKANLVIIELKRDNSGTDVEWQAIKYASYCSSFLTDDIIKKFAEYLKSDYDDAEAKIEEFIEYDDFEKLNEEQRLILVSKEFHSDVISAVLWLREYGINIECIRLKPFLDTENKLFIQPEIIIPLPEAKDYITKKEIKQKELHKSNKSSFSLEKSNYTKDELKIHLIETLNRKSDLTPRLIAFIEILLSEKRKFKREEVKEKLVQKGISNDIGQTGRYLSNISQFLTKKSNPHLRQLIDFSTGGEHGETKDDYYVFDEYRDFLKEIIINFRQTND